MDGPDPALVLDDLHQAAIGGATQGARPRFNRTQWEEAIAVAKGAIASLLSDRELATVLAALRYWQRGPGVETEPEWDIATNGGALKALDHAEIDALCQRLDGRSME